MTSDTPRTDDLQTYVKLPEDIATHADNLEALAGQLERELAAAQAEIAASLLRAPQPDDEAVRQRNFLMSSSVFTSLNANDTFGYATAYSVDFDAEDLPSLLDLYDRFGHAGVTAWMAQEEKLAPLKELQTAEYKAARDFLDNKEQKP
jgi:hypothetical protein